MKKDQNANLKMIYRTQVTGLSHHDYALVAQQIAVGDEVELAVQVGNSFDSEAVSVNFAGEQIGWLPNERDLRAAKSIIHRMLCHDVELRAKVIIHDAANSDLQKRLYIGIYIRLA